MKLQVSLLDLPTPTPPSRFLPCRCQDSLRQRFDTERFVTLTHFYPSCEDLFFFPSKAWRVNKVGSPPRTPSPPQLGRGRGGEEEVGAPEWGGHFQRQDGTECVRARVASAVIFNTGGGETTTFPVKKTPQAERGATGGRSSFTRREKEAREFLARRRVAWRIELNNAIVSTKKDLTLAALFFFSNHTRL